MTKRGNNKFRKQLCFNHGIDNDECNAEMVFVVPDDFDACNDEIAEVFNPMGYAQISFWFQPHNHN